MFNVTFSFALADVPFHFIPKFFWEHDKNTRRLSIFWLTGYIEFSNDVFFEKISDYMEKNELGNQEKDENGLHIICDAPGLNYWQQNRLKNQLTREILEDQEREKREGKKDDSSSKFYFTE